MHEEEKEYHCFTHELIDASTTHHLNTARNLHTISPDIV